MKIVNQFVFQGSREEVWNLLHDPEILKNAFPGTQKFEQTSDDTYEGAMRVGVGPVSGIFSIQVTLNNKVPPERYSMIVEGKGNAGFVKGQAQVELEARDSNATFMKYEADLQIGGRLAVVGQRLLDTVGKNMTRKGLEAMNAMLQQRLNQKGSPE